MTAIAGRLGEFWAAFNQNIGTDPDGSVTTTTVADAGSQVPAGGPSRSVVDITMNGNVDELETTVHNDVTPTHNTARTYIPNFHDETLDLSSRYDEADLVSMAMLVCALNSYLFHFWFVPDGEAYVMSGAGSSGANAFYGTAFSTGFPVGSPLDDTASLDYTLRLSGVQMDTIP